MGKRGAACLLRNLFLVVRIVAMVVIIKISRRHDSRVTISNYNPDRASMYGGVIRVTSLV